jgi:hypothetical protein
MKNITKRSVIKSTGVRMSQLVIMTREKISDDLVKKARAMSKKKTMSHALTIFCAI